LYPELFHIVEPYLQRALRGEAISGVDLMRPAMGTGTEPRRYNVSYQPVWDEAAEVVGVSVAVVEVVAQASANSRLKDPPEVPSQAQTHFQAVWRHTSFGAN